MCGAHFKFLCWSVMVCEYIVFSLSFSPRKRELRESTKESGRGDATPAGGSRSVTTRAGSMAKAGGSEVGVAKTGSSEVGVANTGSSEVGVAKTGSSEVGVAKAEGSEASMTKDGEERERGDGAGDGGDSEYLASESETEDETTIAEQETHEGTVDHSSEVSALEKEGTCTGTSKQY